MVTLRRVGIFSAFQTRQVVKAVKLSFFNTCKNDCNQLFTNALNNKAKESNSIIL